KKKLNDLFQSKVGGVYFRSIVLLGIVFRVSGKVRDFGSKGPERLKYVEKENAITIDLVFSVDMWQGVESSVLAEAVYDGVSKCLSMMVEKSKELNELMEEDELNSALNEVLELFKESHCPV
ncbi:hypothetical protein, partial [Pseudomonas aegrilactucae]